ncbi:Lon protease [Rubripirellula amarantea]|uniref:Lon protease n=1 Tax=Rubripirellula amarantea TaxID=2527999 RepID=A0A5C5WHS5_9BACT|nr:LON peptidase substrate-binding domain-containing protein [Rubripirellula amarantea]TWT50348.1 Lon protease [Rubripirellula amarantea]
MDNLDDVTRLPDEFDGRVRLFPLPDLVVFPHAMQPLHIFEPRYCDLLAESLASDQLIAMATMTGGLPDLKSSDAAIAPTVCICRVISHAEVENDRHNVLLVGIRRATIVQEIDAGRTFRIAEVDAQEDIYSPSKAKYRLALKGKLLTAFSNIIPATATVQKNLHELMAGQMGLGPITDIISYTLPFDVQSKLQLLTESDVDLRADHLIRLLQSGKIKLHSVSIEEQSLDSPSLEQDRSPSEDGFPPAFSLN